MGYFDVVVNDDAFFEIPAKETDYQDVCKAYDELKELFGGDVVDKIVVDGWRKEEAKRSMLAAGHNFKIRRKETITYLNQFFSQSH